MNGRPKGERKEALPSGHHDDCLQKGQRISKKFWKMCSIVVSKHSFYRPGPASGRSNERFHSIPGGIKMKTKSSHQYGTTCATFLATALAIVLAMNPFTAAEAATAKPLHHSEVFLNSLFWQSRIEAPRLGLAAFHTFIAHPSYLQKWQILSADAAALYNDWTNTLVLQPEMTIYDPEFGGERIRSLEEIFSATKSFASVSAGVIFHELSHAEFDLYVEEGIEPYDRELMRVLSIEVPVIARAHNLGPFKSAALASEIFAYYREDLVAMILADTNEIKLASGIQPDTNECIPRSKRPEEARNFSPSSIPYPQRARLMIAFVSGQDVNLNLDPAANKRLNDALEKHTRATLRFPENRVALLERLKKDPKIRAAMKLCLAPN